MVLSLSRRGVGRAGAELGEGDLAGSSSEGKGPDFGLGFERNRESSVQGSRYRSREKMGKIWVG